MRKKEKPEKAQEKSSNRKQNLSVICAVILVILAANGQFHFIDYLNVFSEENIYKDNCEKIESNIFYTKNSSYDGNRIKISGTILNITSLNKLKLVICEDDSGNKFSAIQDASNGDEEVGDYVTIYGCIYGKRSVGITTSESPLVLCRYIEIVKKYYDN